MWFRSMMGGNKECPEIPHPERDLGENFTLPIPISGLPIQSDFPID